MRAGEKARNRRDVARYHGLLLCRLDRSLLDELSRDPDFWRLYRDLRNLGEQISPAEKCHRLLDWFKEMQKILIKNGRYGTLKHVAKMRRNVRAKLKHEVEKEKAGHSRANG